MRATALPPIPPSGTVSFVQRSRVSLTALAIVTLGGALVFGVGQVQGQTPSNDDARRFLGVRKWYVTYTVTAYGAWTHRNRDGIGFESWVVDRTYRGGFVADVQMPDPSLMSALSRAMGGIPQIQWGQRGVRLGGAPSRVFVKVDDSNRGHGRPTMEGYDIAGDHGDSGWTTWAGEGFAPAPETGLVKVDLQKKTYRIELPWKALAENEGVGPVPTTREEVRRAGKKQSAEDSRKLVEVNHTSDTFDSEKLQYVHSERKSRLAFHEIGGVLLEGLAERALPSSGLELGGEVEYQAIFRGTEDTVRVRVSWTCSPSPPPDVELQLSPADYRSWRPGGLHGGGEPVVTEGQPISSGDMTVKLELVDPLTGGPSEMGVAKLSARLTDVSRQPGVCINAPLVAARSPDFDLKISELPGRWTPESDGQLATCKPTKMPWVLRIHCYDYGAWGTLEVNTELLDGREIKGNLIAHRGQEQIKLPKRTGNSKIADSWKEARGKVGVADDADDEVIPVGNGFPGDGLTLYEEYRGFSKDGKWWAGLPIWKELFVYNEDAWDSSMLLGVMEFRSASGVIVHMLMRRGELNFDRVINFNGRQGPHVAEQHGIIMKRAAWGPVRVMPADTVGTPKRIQYIALGRGLPPLGGGVDPSVKSGLARALAQSCNVRLHGTGDQDKRWTLRTDQSGIPWIEETGTGRILVTDERGRPLPISTLELVGGARMTWVGRRGGQHSGNELCLMRWHQADCYIDPSSPDIRYWIAGTDVLPARPILCEGSAGTGRNLPSNDPRSRFGNATVGDCLHQLRVSDR